MIFHSLDYLLFLTGVLALYWLLPHRGQNLLLLMASYLFYGYVHPWFLIPLLGSTLMDWASCLGMVRFPAWRRPLLILSLTGNLGMLMIFKYFNFFVENIAALLRAAGGPELTLTLSILLPVGISFYTFQTMSCTIDVYRGRLQPRRNLCDFALFVTFFPQLVAGPIERADHLLPQIEARRSLNAGQASESLLLLLFGLFKKVVIADNVAVIVEKVFLLQEPGFFTLWAGVFAFGVQIYADFSAYTDMARGSAGLLGFSLMRNFHHPYSANSPIDFWRRWHISLSQWFRDYLYIPLGGSRHGALKNALVLMITFLVSGLWHGASWNYLLWGGYHGLLILLWRGLEPPGRRIPAPVARILKPLRVPLVFLLIHLGWLLFRETDLHALLRDLTLSPLASTPMDRQTGLYLMTQVAIYGLPLWLHGRLAQSDRIPWPWPLQNRHPHLDWIARTLLMLGLFQGILLLHSRVPVDFIYFQF